MSDPAVLRSKIAEDRYINNIAIGLWDWKHPFVRSCVARAGLRVWSPANSVCVLKEVARRVAEAAT